MKTLKLLHHLETTINMHIFRYVCRSFLWQGTIACWIFYPEKKVHIATQIFRPSRYIFKAFLSCLASVLFSTFCCDVYAFHKKLFFLLLLSSVSGIAHFIHTSTVCHDLFFVLNALLSLQTKDNHFWASDLQQHFN